MSIPYEDLADITQIGSGSFGVMSKADYLGTEVAIKTFIDLSKQDPGFNVHKYIEREVEILKEARHPNVVQFMGSIIHDSKVLLVTEFVSGGNVKDWIQDAERELSERMKISIAIDVARAMAYLHAHNIIHRDLKSENLLVTENKRIKVCDFGFSRPTPKTADELRRLSFCGTDSHMAPEIILGIPFDKRVDVFSFGVVLCELAARACVDDSGGVFSRVIPGFGIDEEEVWRRAEKEGAAQRGVEWIAMALKCCETEPADRPSWKAVLGVLKEEELRVIREEPTHAGVLPREKAMLTHSQSIGSLGSFANLSFGSVDGSTWQNFNQLSIGSLASLTQMISLDLSARSDPSLGQNGSPSSSPTLSRRSLSSPPLLVLDPSHPRSASPTPLYIPVGSAVGANVAVPAALLAAVSLPVSPVSPLSPSDERLSLGPDPLSPAGQRLLGPRLSISTSELNSAVAAAGGPLSPVQAGSTGVREVRMGHAIPHRFSLVRSASMPRCEQCARRVIGVANRFLQCDDCGAVFHKRCGSSAPTSCGIPKELRRYLFPPAGRARGALRPVSLSSSHSSIASAGAGAANEVSSSSLARHFQEAHSTAPEATGNSVAAAAATSQTQASSSRNGSHELFRRASLFPLYTRPSSQHGLQHHGHKDDSHLPNSVGGSVDSGAHGLGSTQQQFQPQPLHQRSTSLKIALSSSGAGIHGRRGKRELPVAGPVPPSVSGVPAGDSGSGGSKAGKSQHTSIADPAATAGKEEKEGKMNVASKGATVLQVGSDLAFEKSSTERETAFSSSETVVEPTS